MRSASSAAWRSGSQLKFSRLLLPPQRGFTLWPGISKACPQALGMTQPPRQLEFSHRLRQLEVQRVREQFAGIALRHCSTFLRPAWTFLNSPSQ